MRRETRSKNALTVVHLQEQVTLLTTENERLKAILAQHGLNNVLQPNTRIPNDENIENKKARGSVAGSTTPNTPKAMGKGCSCRGNCATRVCGCVKKNVPCAEFCRCGDELCQNQEPDKENIGDPNNQAQLSKDGQDSLEKLARLSLKATNVSKQKKSARAQASDKQAENVAKHPGLFSPVPAANDFANFNDDKYVHRVIRFGDKNDSDETSDSDDDIFQKRAELTNKEKKEIKNVTSRKREIKNVEKTKDAAGCSGQENLKLPEPPKKIRSLSNNENETETNVNKKIRTRRSISVDGRGRKAAAKEKPAKTLAALMNGLRPFRRATAKPGRSRIISSSETDNGKIIKPIEEKKIDQTSRRKKGSKILKSTNEENIGKSTNDTEEATNYRETERMKRTKKMPAKKIEKKAVPVEKEEEEEEEDKGESDKESDNSSEHENVVKIEDNEDQIKENAEQRNDENMPEISHDSGNSEPSTSGISQNSDLASSNNSPNSQENDEFDPMKPRPKLSRSPIVPRNDSRYYQALDISERPLPPPVEEEPIIELPPPKELEEVVVDWEKHQAALVFCRKCGRGFYEYRLKKHEATCQKV